MADIHSQATVDLIVNGKAADAELKRLKDRASELQQKIDRCVIKGDTKGAERLQKQLDRVNKQLDKISQSNLNFNRTLKNLDKASVKELESALKSLQTQFKKLERGSDEWKRQAELIKRVKAEIHSANSAISVMSANTKSTGTKIIEFFNKWQIAILGVAAALAGIIQTGRKAVSAYAEMDEAMANTRKFTGMTAEQVEELNDAFRNMDTRTARDKLNELAQEAGRLGKSSREDVLGYVKAADVINVALSDLGEGATQSIAKLSNIFKIEDRYGTYDAMLKIGSVVNVLSQNCTASKPYLVEFANRLAGVGNQAHISLQNIIGFGAVLDANAQKVEASATAIGQVLTRMYRDPAKYAKVAGIDIKKFTDTLRKDANEALLLFLETLGKAGDLNVLSPMFKDMGENGARVITALSTLSKHIDEVRWQQKNANKAFNEGTSVLHEYNIFNNTAQAGIDKAKKRIAELGVQLGEKLLPVIKHFYTSTSLTLRVLSAVVSFISANKKELVALTAAITTLYITQNAATISTKALSIATSTWAAICKAIPATTAILKVALAGLTNAVNYFTNGLQVNYEMQLRWRNSVAALAAAGPAKVFIAASAVGVALGKVLINLISKYNSLTEVAKTMNDIRSKAAEKVVEETTKIKYLMEAAADLNKSEEDRLRICAELNKTVPNMSANIDIMTGAFIYSTKAVNDHIKALTHLYEIEGAKDKLKELGKKRANLTVKQTELEQEKESIDATRNLSIDSYTGPQTTGNGGLPGLVNVLTNSAGQVAAVDIDLKKTTRELKIVDDQISTIYKTYGVMELTASNNPESDHNQEFYNSSGYTSSKSAEKEAKKAAAAARAAAVKAKKAFKDELNKAKGDWEEADAKNIAERSQGLKSWNDFLTDKFKLQRKFYNDQLSIFRKHNLKEDEDYKELLKKKEQLNADWLKRKAAMTVEEAVNNQKADELQAQMDFSTPGREIFGNEEALQIRLFDIRMKYLDKKRAAYDKASEEYHKYSIQMEEAEGQERLRLQKLFAERIKKYNLEWQLKDSAEKYKEVVSYVTALWASGNISMKQYQEALAKAKQEFVLEKMPDSAKKELPEGEADSLAHQKELAQLQSMYDAKMISEKEYLEAKERMEKKYQDRAINRARNAGNEFSNMVLDLYTAFKAFGEDNGDNLWSKMANAAQASLAVMSAAMSAVSDFMKAETDIVVAQIEKRYDREIALAEGNVFKQKQAEKKKQKEIAKAKNEANRKMFAMQVIQAVAQTATNAIAAYGSAASVPVIGYILAPIAAAMAVAAGAVQIAAIKKQQQASEAQGYMEGGFTPNGPKDKTVGVVHAGEWVAPQEIVNSPKTRPIINLLETARRQNRITSISFEDVSAATSTPVAIERAARRRVVFREQSAQSDNKTAQDNRLNETLDRLYSRLNEPFVTINSVTGEYGSKRAQDEYDRLIRNKSWKK